MALSRKIRKKYNFTSKPVKLDGVDYLRGKPGIYIKMFWIRVNKGTYNRLELLQGFSSLQFYNSESLIRRRRIYDKWKYDVTMDPDCFVCSDPAEIRHHVVWLKNGGSNSKQNLVSLCNDCHGEIHPWLKVPDK